MLKLLLMIGVLLGLAAAWVLPPAFADDAAEPGRPAPPAGDARE